jgi:hypothetical protein
LIDYNAQSSEYKDCLGFFAAESVQPIVLAQAAPLSLSALRLLFMQKAAIELFNQLKAN